MIEVSIAHDKALNSLSDFAQLLYLKILPHTDDWGRFEGDPVVVKARVDPLSTKAVKKYENAMQEIASAGLWKWYKTDNGKMVVQYHEQSFERINAFLIKNRKNSEFPPYKDSYQSISQGYAPITNRKIILESKETKDKDTVDLAKEEPAKPSPSMLFEQIWANYPRRDGRKDALKHFLASVETEEDFKSITAALENYRKWLKKNHTEEQYIKKGSTWFNNWRDWIPEDKPRKKIQQATYLCSECNKVHTIDEDCPVLKAKADAQDPSKAIENIGEMMRNMSV